ncbi:pleckstrin homology domain-containing family G member 1 isoform X1 [Coregonus clupeaformis]|uniref:pleckstrin homology domain-containing family G member 1 isoform X1 n=2 Tax=Coregonus clupeaformis TaxID=59861 RepID=UPI001E1C3194|nr:pleckstrin homology domain-containing family G member 1 isoform X1 [Coregonus clupeaformis]
MPTDDYTDALPPLPEIPDADSVLSSVGVPGRFRHSDIRHAPLRYCSAHSMDSSPDSGERPISYGSTSSSASSRDSHCSLGSRSTLSPSPHCHPASDRDLDSGAIRLELVPARQLGCGDEEERKDGGTETGRGMVKQGSAQTPQSDTEAGERSTPGPRVQYVDRVVQEILDTESTYVQDLRSIVQDYLECISNQSRLALSSEERGSLFGNIRDIYHFNRDLLHDLEKCNSDPVAIAECFVSKSEEFHIYTQYCTNYPRSVAVLTECMRNKALAKFFRERQESLRHSLPLGSYLLKPVQRILKYHLLLHEIANHLEKDTETYEVVQEAIDTMQRVAWHINDMKRKHEHAVRLQEIQSLLTNWKGPDLIGYGELVLEGTFRLQRAKNERTLFLFDKLLLVTKKREEAYTYKAHILCCNLMLVEVIPKEPLSFSVFHYKNPKLQHTVQAKSQQDKRMWILHLKKLILENHPAKIPAKAKQAILEMDAMHHPGFHYSPDGDKRSPHTMEGPSPRRVHRKSEPLSKLLKNAKHGAKEDGSKRMSLGATLLSPVSQLALGTIGRSHSLVNQSQKSLDPGDHFDHSDREDGEEPHQQDADDEDDSGLGGGKRLRVPGKSSRKRLNQQASIDSSFNQWKTFNMSTSDLQRAKEGHHPPLLRTPCVTEEPPEPHVPSMLVPDSDPQTVGNIWADHRVRRAMFPTRQCTMNPDEEDEDIYQMFVPTEPGGPEPPPVRSEVTSSPSRTQGRPCSWHVEQVPLVQIDPPSTEDSRVLRRASSVGEKQTGARQSPPDQDDNQEGMIHTESSSNDISASSSAEQLTIDDIENVYDNISYEDLKSMGLIRREQEGWGAQREAPRHTQVPGALNTGVTGGITEPLIEPDSLSDSNRSSTAQEGAPFGTCELKIMEEENIYDTICFREPPAKGDRDGDKKAQEKDSLLQSASETDLMGCEGLGGFMSEESLHFGEDEGMEDNSHPVHGTSEPHYSSSSASKTFSQRSHTGDQMSEQVDEIWNDLENYIKKNEKKVERLPAAFPVSTSEASKTSSVKSSPKKNNPHTASPQTRSPQTRSPPTKRPIARHPNPPTVTPPHQFTIPILNIPELLREGTFEDEDHYPSHSPLTPPSLPLPAIPDPAPPGTVKSIRNKLARLSSGSFRLEDDDELGELPQRELSQRDLHSLFPGELGLDSPLASSSLLLGDSVDSFSQELMDKTKNRVFLMARQYSQKIKKANQLLRMKSMDLSDMSGGRNREEKKQQKDLEKKQNDLAAILEEKKQGGAAIGARIAEYSQLYDQVMFKDPPGQGSSNLGPPGSHYAHPGLPSSQSLPESCSSLGLEDDWLHSTYSNRELTSFVSEMRSSTPKSKFTPACSIPALKTLPPSPETPPTQRWSSCVSAPSEKEEHVYSYIKRHTSFNSPSSSSSSSKPPPYSRCQSICSLGDLQEKENDRAGSKRGPTAVQRSSERLHGPSSLVRAGRQSSLPERSSFGHGHSDLTLQDSQQVVVLNRASALSVLTATQNYMANFKDNGDDDDDDYVEIRSENESKQDQDCSRQRNSGGGGGISRGPAQSQTQSLPCTPVRSSCGLMDRECLQEYLWAEQQTQQNQSNIVQSLREKFQCLSSSSFA